FEKYLNPDSFYYLYHETQSPEVKKIIEDTIRYIRKDRFFQKRGLFISDAARMAKLPAAIHVSPSLVAAVNLDDTNHGMAQLVRASKLAQSAGADRLHYVVIDQTGTPIVQASTARVNTAIFSPGNLQNLRNAGVTLPFEVHLEAM